MGNIERSATDNHSWWRRDDTDCGEPRMALVLAFQPATVCWTTEMLGRYERQEKGHAAGPEGQQRRDRIREVLSM